MKGYILFMLLTSGSGHATSTSSTTIEFKTEKQCVVMAQKLRETFGRRVNYLTCLPQEVD